jgi:hypothetical protein
MRRRYASSLLVYKQVRRGHCKCPPPLKFECAHGIISSQCSLVVELITRIWIRSFSQLRYVRKAEKVQFRTSQSLSLDNLYNFLAVISRQFRDMTRTRIKSLLASFPKLIPTNTQHTSVETAEVRYVYQPLEDLYILLITNNAARYRDLASICPCRLRYVQECGRTGDSQELIRTFGRFR